MSIRVAVRVRPFNQRETNNKATCCIQMNGNTTSIVNENGLKKEFSFDYSLWSHDGFKTRDDGYSEPENPKYVDQMGVYNELGKSVLDSAWEGYHCCLFAYGQTGSGKSYSMIGYGANKGIVPLATEEIFQRIEAHRSAEKSFEVTVTMVEIYNEKVQDLLINPSKRPAQGLKIRENKTLGTYVEGLSKYPVNSYKQIELRMEEGNRNRTIGSTQMNATSSRAHTVIAIEFKQITHFGGKKAEKFSVINLVDLAGSEKADQSGAVGDRLKEGCAINKSLTCLGQVISILADKATGKAKKQVVPYRESALTRMLQNALGGNSKTIMICALSPASINYEETLSTLRYADRAKKILNKAVVNESAQDKMIRVLQEENERLKAELAKKGGVNQNQVNDYQAQRRLKEMEEELQTNLRAMREMEMTWEQKLEAAKKREAEEANNQEDQSQRVNSRPHLVNLNEDPMLDRKIFYDLTQSKQVLVGRKNGNPQPQIILGGIGIQPNHACFEKGDDGQIYLKPQSEKAFEQISVNGKKVKSSEGLELKPNDRIVFGTNSVFLFKHPSKEEEATLNDPPDAPISYEQAQKEKTDEEDKFNQIAQKDLQQKQEQEARAKMEELERKMELEKKEQEAIMEKLQKEYEDKLKFIESQAAGQGQDNKEKQKIEEEMKLELERQEKEKIKQERARQVAKEQQEAKIKKRQGEQAELERQLGLILPIVNEVNLIAKELQRDIKFSTKLVKVLPDQRGPEQSLSLTEMGKTDIMIRVDNAEEGYYYQWDGAKLQDRAFIMRDLVNDYFESAELPELDKESDPFWDPPEPMLIGQSFLSLKNLAYLVENEVEAKLLSSEGLSGVRGVLSVKYIPTDDNGEGEPDEDLLPEEPEDLIGKSVTFTVEIDWAQDLPLDLCKNVFVMYGLQFEKSKVLTPETQGKDRNPKFNFKRVHQIEQVTQGVLNYLLNDQLCFKVYGYPDTVNKAQQKQNHHSKNKEKEERKEGQNSSTRQLPQQDSTGQTKKESNNDSKLLTQEEILQFEGKQRQAENGTQQPQKIQKVSASSTKKTTSCCLVF